MFQKLKSALGTPTGESPSTATSAFPSRAGSPPPADANHAARAPAERELAQSLLTRASIPVSLDDCRTCSDPCDEDEHAGGGGPTHVSYPRNFDVDWESELLGSSKPNDRQLVVSTGKSDWPHDHTEDKTSLSHHLAKVLPEPKSGKKNEAQDDDGVPPGIYDSAPLASSRFGLFSSSLVSHSRHESGDSAGGLHQSVLVFPDWQVVLDVENSPRGAQELVDGVLGGGGAGRQQTWTLPYRAVVLLCSHKRRDKRCHVAAPLLEKVRPPPEGV